MYSSAFCKVYNEFGWNYFPEAFGEELIAWLNQNQVQVKTGMDLACGTGILCEILWKNGIRAAGMDFSDGMIEIAKKNNPEIFYEVADMVTYRPAEKFDLVTCTGDALNHIINLKDVEQIFQNVYGYLNTGGYFIFDILNEKEVSFGDPIDLDFSDTVKAQFLITQDQEGMIRLKTTVFENGVLQFEEVITETVHEISEVLEMLRRCGFQVVQCGHTLLEEKDTQAATWYVIARK